MNTSCEVTLDLRNATYFSHLLYTPIEKMLFSTIWPCIILVGLIGNLLFIRTVIRTPFLHTSTYIYLTSISYTDIGVLIGIGIVYITDILYNQVRFAKISILIAFFVTLVNFCFVNSGSFMTLVSVERYLTICHPIKHHILKGSKRTWKVICIILIISLTLSIVTLLYVLDYSTGCVLWPEGPDFVNLPRIIHLSTLSLHTEGTFVKMGDAGSAVGVIILAIVNYFMYTRILQVLKQRKENKELQTSAELERNIRQASLMVLINGVIFFLCYGAYAIVSFGNVFYSFFRFRIFHEENVPFLRDLINSLMLLNASVNPFIYLIINQRYRHAFMTSLNIIA